MGFDRKYFLASINALSEYMHRKNGNNTNFEYYVVYEGKTKGIFKTWEETVEQIRGYPRPLFKGFLNYDKKSMENNEEEYIENMDIEMPEIILGGRCYPIKRIFKSANGKILEENSLLRIETRALDKGQIEEDERLAYDKEGNLVVIELIEEEDTIEMMDDEVSTAQSPTPFHRHQPITNRTT